jgi:hypothetical protein
VSGAVPDTEFTPQVPPRRSDLESGFQIAEAPP